MEHGKAGNRKSEELEHRRYGKWRIGKVENWNKGCGETENVGNRKIVFSQYQATNVLTSQQIRAHQSTNKIRANQSTDRARASQPTNRIRANQSTTEFVLASGHTRFMLTSRQTRFVLAC